MEKSFEIYQSSKISESMSKSFSNITTDDKSQEFFIGLSKNRILLVLTQLSKILTHEINSLYSQHNYWCGKIIHFSIRKNIFFQPWNPQLKILNLDYILLETISFEWVWAHWVQLQHLNTIFTKISFTSIIWWLKTIVLKK